MQLDQEAETASQALSTQPTSEMARQGSLRTTVGGDGETRLLEQDRRLNTALQDAYRSAARDARPQSDADLTRTALLHWTTVLRRRAMGRWHTVVPGLENDPRCEGDVIGDQLLLKYFHTLFDDPGTHASRRAAVNALGALARQSACLGAEQSANLASHFYWSFNELRSFLRLNGLQRIVPAVAQAGAAPLLLFYDVEKHRGLWSPLARWFTENREHLVAGAITHRLPASWQGLWLYNRRTGQLIGFSPTVQPLDENHVDLPSFLDSIISAENLADNTCTFSEMIMRGSGKFGYMCSGSACQKASGEGDRGRPTAAPAEAGRPESESGGSEFGRVGYSAGVLKETTCKEGGPGGGGGPCASATAAGRDTLAALLNCIADLRMTPDEKLLKCTAEASGRCSSPAERFAKRLQPTSFNGVPMGGCDLAKGKKGDPPGTMYTDKGLKIFPLVDFEKQAKEAEEKRKQAEKNILTTTDMEQAEKELNEAKEEEKTAKEDLEKAKKQTEESKKKKDQRCAEDTPDCGFNDCTAMSAQMQQTMACIQAALGADPAPALPGGGVFDPSPDTPDATGALTQCLKSIDAEQPTASRCWTVKCGGNRVTTLSGAGDCGCGGEVGPGGLTGGTVGAVLCGGLMDCGEDKRQDGCLCVPVAEGPGGGVSPGGPQPSSGPLVVPEPPTYSDVRFPH